MTLIRWMLLVLVLSLCTTVSAERVPVAVPEFQNNSDRIVHISRWDLAVWMMNELKKTHQFAPIDRKKVNEVVKDAHWSYGRLEESDESKLKDLSAHYVLYGTIMRWDLTTAVTSQTPLSGPAPSTKTSAVIVVFSFDLVDLNSRTVIKNLIVDGSALGEPEDPADLPKPLDDSKYDQVFEDACKSVFHRVAQQIAKVVQELK